MDVFQAIHTRRTVRKFSDRELEWDKVAQVLEAGKAAPSAGNLQPWKFIVVADKAKKRALADASLQQWWLETAPILIVVVADVERTKQFYGIRGERLYSIQDCSAAAQNMLLAATALGVGSAWISAFEEEAVNRALGIPTEARAQAIIALGYQSEEPKEAPKNPLYNVVFLEKFGNRVRDPLRSYFGQYSHIWEAKASEGKAAVQKASVNVLEKIKEYGKKWFVKQEIKQETDKKP
jgi:nitroreductase